MLDPARAHTLILYGGAFDPPHLAHTTLPLEAARAIHADGVLFIPTGSPPHKPGPIAPAHHRLAMLKLALADHPHPPHASTCDFELQRPGPNYTIDTLRHLRATLGPAPTFRLLIGADMAASFYAWRQPLDVIALAEPLVMLRPPHTADSVLASLPHDLPATERERWRSRFIPVPQLDISSTQLRQLLAAADYNNAHLTRSLHPAVLQYIKSHRLYL